MPRSIDRAALDRMTMMTMMMTRGDDGDDDPSPQIHIISHKVRHGPTRNMMESMVRHRPTTAQSIPNASHTPHNPSPQNPIMTQGQAWPDQKHDGKLYSQAPPNHSTCHMYFFLYRKRFLRIREVCKHFTCNVAAKHTAAPISLSSA